MIKKSIVFSLIAILLLACFGCAGGTSLFAKMGSDTQKWADQFDPADPPALTVYTQTNGYAQEPAEISNPNTIVSVFDALAAVTVGDRAEADETQTFYTLTFAAKDGSKQSFCLREDGCVLIGENTFQTENGRAVLLAAGIVSSSAIGSALQMPVTEDNSSNTQGDALVFSSEEMNFSFLYSPAYTAQLSEGGSAVVYIDSTQEIPNFRILRISNGPSAQEYLEEKLFSAQMEHGDNLIQDSGAPADIGMEGRSVYGIVYAYQDSASGSAIEVVSFAETLSDGSIAVYTATSIQDDSDIVISALKDAISTFQPDANYYTSPNTGAQPTVQPVSSYVLENYNGGVFTMQLPRGWVIQTAGEYASFTFHAYDPNDPDVQIFMCGELGPYFKSEAGKAGYRQMSGGTDFISNLPVLDPGTLQGCLNSLDEYETVYNASVPTPFDFPDIHNLSNISEQPITTFLSGIASSESMMMADLTSTTGSPCIGIFQGSIIDVGGIDFNGTDVAPGRSAMNVMGVVAPSDRFADVYETLIQSLCSFAFTQEYVQAGIDYTNSVGQSALEYARQNEAMMDEINRNFLDYINDTVTIYIVD